MNNTLFCYGKKISRAASLAGFLFLSVCSTTSYARPEMSPLGPNIADKGSAFYHFTVSTLDSADGIRHYKVWTGIPRQQPPAEGYPVLYMLDGNAVMDKLSDTLLAKLAERSAPVLVVIGYQTALPFEQQARAYDYTPSLKGQNGVPQEDRRGRAMGGSVAFRHLLEETIAPVVEKTSTINPHKRGLWGHSYGGLFVMDTCLSSSFFNYYYSASPSLGRDNFTLLRDMAAVTKNGFRHQHLTFFEGDGDPKINRDDGAVDVLKAVRSTVSTLRIRGVPADYWLYPGLKHGEMFIASLQSALFLFSADD